MLKAQPKVVHVPNDDRIKVNTLFRQYPVDHLYGMGAEDLEKSIGTVQNINPNEVENNELKAVDFLDGGGGAFYRNGITVISDNLKNTSQYEPYLRHELGHRLSHIVLGCRTFNPTYVLAMYWVKMIKIS